MMPPPETAKSIDAAVPANASTSRRLMIATCLWFAIALQVAMLAPWLGLWPEMVGRLVGGLFVFVTLALIAGVLTAAQRLLTRTGRTVATLPYSVLLILLFGLLFFQLASHQGAELYHWQTTPGPSDWFLFTLTHLFRAADLFDTLEAFGWRTQAIAHDSVVVGTILFLFHLFMDFFVISLLAEWFLRVKHWIARSGWRTALTWGARGLLILWVLVWIVSAMWLRPWQIRDIPLWFVDNVLRVLDFADVMQLCGARLHSVPQLAWEGSLTFSFRLILVIALAGYVGGAVRWLRVRCFGVSSLPLEDVRELIGHRSPAIAAAARQRLAQLQQLPPHATWNRAMGRSVLLSSVILLVGGLVALALPPWDRAAQRLAERTTSGDVPPQTIGSSIMALRKMGSYADGVSGQLGDWLSERQATDPLAVVVENSMDAQVISALGSMGARGFAVLSRLIATAEEGSRRTAMVRELSRGGELAGPAIVTLLAAKDPTLQRETQQLLEELGAEAVPPLITALSADNAVFVMQSIKQLDPYWHLRSSENPIFMQYVESRERVARLQKDLTSQNEPMKQLEAMLQTQQAMDAGDAWALPVLLAGLVHEDGGIRSQAAFYFSDPSRESLAQRYVARLLEAGSDEEIDLALKALDRLGELGATAILYLLIRYRADAKYLADSSPTDDLDRRRVIAPRLNTSFTLLRRAANDRQVARRIEDASPQPLSASFSSLAVDCWRLSRQEYQRKTFVDLLAECKPQWWASEEGRAAIEQWNQRFAEEPLRYRDVYARLGPVADLAVPAYRQVLADVAAGKDNVVARRITMELIRNAGELARDLTADLTQLLRQETPAAIRDEVVSTLHAVDPNWGYSDEGRQALQRLLTALRESDDPLPILRTLDRCGEQVLATPGFFDCLANEDRVVTARVVAITAKSKPLRSALAEYAERSDSIAREQARDLLKRLNRVD